MADAKRLAELEAHCRAGNGCLGCELGHHRKNIVWADGSLDADVMLIGEGPGAKEDATGTPFCGPAGEFLNELIATAGLTRSQFYITNIIKCRTDEANRDPQPFEIVQCSYWLVNQIKAIEPKLICSLGNPATRTLIGATLGDAYPGISKLRQHFYATKGGRTVLPMFHPAAALHNPDFKQACFDDFELLAKFLRGEVDLKKETA